ncbi:MAG: hypothetical protein AB1673_07980 [Actinomycetota bacterium]
MRVEFEYTPSYVVGDPAVAHYDSPIQFSIWFHWDPPISDDAVYLHVFVGQDVEALVSAESPPRLHGVNGLVTSLEAWRLVPEIVGSEVWQEALRVVEGELIDQSLEIDPATLEPLRGTWQSLLEAANSKRVTGMRQPKGEWEKILAALQSDPKLWEAHLQGMEDVFNKLEREKGEENGPGN